MKNATTVSSAVRFLEADTRSEPSVSSSVRPRPCPTARVAHRAGRRRPRQRARAVANASSVLLGRHDPDAGARLRKRDLAAEACRARRKPVFARQRVRRQLLGRSRFGGFALQLCRHRKPAQRARQHAAGDARIDQCLAALRALHRAAQVPIDERQRAADARLRVGDRHVAARLRQFELLAEAGARRGSAGDVVATGDLRLRVLAGACGEHERDHAGGDQRRAACSGSRSDGLPTEPDFSISTG